jgi:hypothetical protein
MDAVTAAGEVAKTISGDFIMTGIMLFIFILSTGYLVKIIRALVRDNKAQINEINLHHQNQIQTMVTDHHSRVDGLNQSYQASIERMNAELIDLNQKSLETQKSLLETIKENNEIILQSTGASIRLEASIDALVKAVRQASNS